jgi:hypothetical protein
MFTRIRKHWWKVVGAILVGAVGSGVWETLVKPFLLLVSNALLTISTLGLQVLVDDVYLEIARGLHEDASVQLLVLMLTLIPLALLDRVIALRHVIEKAKAREALRVLPSQMTGTPPADGNAQSTERIAIAQAVRRGLIVLSVGLCTFATFMQVRFLYVNRAIVYFKQSSDVAAPFLSDTEEEVVRATFVSIRSREDFVQLTNMLDGVIKKNGKTPPKFTLW